MRLGLGLLGIVGCGEPEVPAACEEMCQAAAALYGACLEAEGAGWEAAGYEDEADFLAACGTWGWEMALLEADARARGELAEEGALAAVCAERRDALAAEGAACEDYTGIDWHTPPW